MTQRPPVEADTSALMDVLEAAVSAGRAPNIALMHVILLASDEGAVGDALAAARTRIPAAFWNELTALWTGTPDVFPRLKLLARQVHHGTMPGESPAAALARFRKGFDSAAALDPVGSVALYTLGRDDLHGAVIAETVDLLHGLDLLSPEPDIVEIGCGTGHLAVALGRHCRSYRGLDLSPVMVGLARQARGPLPHLTFNITDGRHLAAETSSADLVLAVDVMPYAELAGEATSVDLLRECARVLRPGRAMLILNLAYGCTAEQEVDRASRRAPDAGLSMTRAALAPFTYWDARMFLFRKPMRPVP